jgi:glucan 1,3-beta-glucosidase
LVDLHGLPGSQNGFDNSGEVTSGGTWDPTAINATKYVRMVAERYINDTDTVTDLGVVNEAFPARIKRSTDDLEVYFNNSIHEVKKLYRNTDDDKVMPTVWLGGNYLFKLEGFIDVWLWAGKFLSDAKDLIMDVHFYVTFDYSMERRKASADCFAFRACGKGFSTSAFSNREVNVVFGEWSGATTDCTKYLNGYKWLSRYEGSFPVWNPFARIGSCSDFTNPISEWTPQRKRDTRLFIEAQLDAVYLLIYFL